MFYFSVGILKDWSCCACRITTSQWNAAGAREMYQDSSHRQVSQGVSLLCTSFNTLDHQKAVTVAVCLKVCQKCSNNAHQADCCGFDTCMVTSLVSIVLTVSSRPINHFLFLETHKVHNAGCLLFCQMYMFPMLSHLYSIESVQANKMMPCDAGDV